MTKFEFNGTQYVLKFRHSAPLPDLRLKAHKGHPVYIDVGGELVCHDCQVRIGDKYAKRQEGRNTTCTLGVLDYKGNVAWEDFATAYQNPIDNFSLPFGVLLSLVRLSEEYPRGLRKALFHVLEQGYPKSYALLKSGKVKV